MPNSAVGSLSRRQGSVGGSDGRGGVCGCGGASVILLSLVSLENTEVNSYHTDLDLPLVSAWPGPKGGGDCQHQDLCQETM